MTSFILDLPPPPALALRAKRLAPILQQELAASRAAPTFRGQVEFLTRGGATLRLLRNAA